MNEFLQYEKKDFNVIYPSLPEIIDFHVHVGLTAPFPFLKCDINNENADNAKYLGTSNPRTFDDEKFYHNNFPSMLSPGFLPYSVAYLYKMFKFFPTCTIQNLLKYKKKYNIKKIVIQIIDFPKLNQCEKILKSASNHKNLVMFCYVDPKDPGMENQLKRYKKLGASGLKYHPIVSGINPSCDSAMKLFQKCSELNMPVLSHSGQGPVKKGFGKDPSRMEYFEPVFSNFPDLKFILAHIGSVEYKKAIDFALKYDNVYLETSESPAFVIKEAAEKLAGEKIFFGTDYSFNHPAVPLSILLDATKNNEEFREKILILNAENFLEENTPLDNSFF